MTKAVVTLLSGIHLAGLLVGTDGALSLNAHCLGVGSASQGLFQYTHRVLAAPMFHASLLHLGLNMAAFCSGMAQTFERERLGSLRFAVLLLLLSIIGGTSTLALRMVGETLGLLGVACGVGFSGVLFGLIALDATGPGAAREQTLFGLVHVPGWSYPFILLLAAAFLMPNVDSVGHLGGILAGVALGRQGLRGLRMSLPSERILQSVEEHAAALFPAVLVNTIRSQGYVSAAACEWHRQVEVQPESSSSAFSDRTGWMEGWGLGPSGATSSASSTNPSATPLPLWGSVPPPTPVGRTVGGSAAGIGEGELDPLMRAFDRHVEEGGRSEASRAAGLAAMRRMQANRDPVATARSREESPRASSSELASPRARSAHSSQHSPHSGSGEATL